MGITFTSILAHESHLSKFGGKLVRNQLVRNL